MNLINNTKGNIVFTGVGKSKLILEKTCGTFSSLGISSYVLDANQASHGGLGSLQKNDTLVIASNSGNTNELVSILKYAKKYKIKIIGISSNQNLNYQKLRHKYYLSENKKWVIKTFLLFQQVQQQY